MSRRTQQNKLRIERLEQREVPAATIDPMTGIITIDSDFDGIGSTQETIVLDTVPGFVRIAQNGVVYDFPVGQATAIQTRASDWVNTYQATAYVERVLDSTPVHIREVDRVILSALAQDLDHVAGSINVDDCINLIVNDQQATKSVTYQITAHGISIGPARTFGGLSISPAYFPPNLTLNMSNLGGIADLTSAIEFDRNWRLVGGESIDIFNIGPVGESSLATDDIQVYGNGGADILNIHGGPNERGMSISASQVTWYGDGRPGSVYGGSLTYDSVAALNVTGTGFISYMYNPTTARYVISGPFPNTLVTIDGGGEMDTLVVPTTANTWSLATHADSRVNNVTFKNFECLEGGSLGDTFRFAGWTSWWQSIDGGGGLDSLDYSQHPIGVSVDLASGTGVGVNQVFRIENVTGSPFADTLRGDAAANVLNGLGGNDLIEGRDGANIIDGGDGNDTLTAGSGNDLFRAGSGNDRVTAGGGDDIAYGAAGNDNIDGGDGNDAIFGQADKDALQGGLGRDILFGGTGIDLLNGGAGDDILSSGDFLNDLIISRVDAIRAEWTSNHTYSDRVANLRGNAAGSTTYASRLNGNIFLTTMGASPSVILSLVAEDSLTGGSTTPSDPNQDWFFGRTAELIDRKSNESVN